MRPPGTRAERFVLTSVGSIEPHGSRTAGTRKVGSMQFAPRLTVRGLAGWLTVEAQCDAFGAASYGSHYSTLYCGADERALLI
jgi:hypothetical protein